MPKPPLQSTVNITQTLLPNRVGVQLLQLPLCDTGITFFTRSELSEHVIMTICFGTHWFWKHLVGSTELKYQVEFNCSTIGKLVVFNSSSGSIELPLLESFIVPCVFPDHEYAKPM